MALFRGGNEEAFRIIHDRYHQRLFAYTRQMLPGSRHDAEDALQDIFVRAYSGLRATDRQLALRAWLYRVAHNRCIDELRRPPPPSPEVMEIVRPPTHDPIAIAERRDSLRRLIEDVRRLPEQQRSALLMRELGGMAYTDLAAALAVSVPAVKSLLVRARIGLAQSMEARDAACHEIREELAGAHDRGVRPSGIARRHMHDCPQCRAFRVQIRGTSRSLAALVPLGPLAVIGQMFGFGGGAAGSGAAGSGAAGSGAAAAGGVAGTSGAVATISAVAGGAATHVATIIAAAAVVTAGGAVEIQRSVSTTHHAAHHAVTGAASSSSEPATDGPSGSPPPTAGSPGASAGGTPIATIQRVPSSLSPSTTATAGPDIPSVDQLNPADSTGAVTGTGSATTGSMTSPGDGTTGGDTGTASGTTGGPTDTNGTGAEGQGTTGSSGSSGTATSGTSTSGSTSATGDGSSGTVTSTPTGASTKSGGTSGSAESISGGSSGAQSTSGKTVAVPAISRAPARTTRRAVKKRVSVVRVKKTRHHPRRHHRG